MDRRKQHLSATSESVGAHDLHRPTVIGFVVQHEFCRILAAKLPSSSQRIR